VDSLLFIVHRYDDAYKTVICHDQLFVKKVFYLQVINSYTGTNSWDGTRAH
jgi:hypothetical protein